MIRKPVTLAVCLAALMLARPAHAEDPSAAARADLAPNGTLRAAINFGNPVLAQRDPVTKAPSGVSADLATELSRRLGVPLTFVIFEEAGEVAKEAAHKIWDVGFLAIDPKRATTITFTAPYVLIEGAYLVSATSPIQSNDAVDKPGMLVGVAEGSAYDLYLTRALREAKLLRELNTTANIATLRAGKIQVVGGVKIPLDDFARGNPDVRVLPGRFMVIEQAMTIPNGHDAGAKYLAGFVEEMKASGFVADALKRSGQTAAAVAPPTR